MSGATGAGSSGTSTGSTAGSDTGGGRGSAAPANDPHTTQLKAIKSPAKGSPSPDARGSQGDL